jgi:small-conductance mechanosensitive channel
MIIGLYISYLLSRYGVLISGLRYNNYCARRLSSTTMIPTGPGKDKYHWTRVSLSQSPSSSKDFQHPLGATEYTAARGSDQLSAFWQAQAYRAPPSHHSEDKQHTLESSPAQGSGYTQWISKYILRGGRTRDELKQAQEKHDRELEKKNGELRQASHIVDNLQQENKRSKDTINSLQDKLINVHRQLEDAKKLSDQPSAETPGRSQPGKPPPQDAYQNQYRTLLLAKNRELRQARHTLDNLQHEDQRSKDTISSLQNALINHRQLEDAKKLSEVHEKELVSSQVFLAKADTLSISEVGEKVTALNEGIFQAAARLGEAIVRKRREVSQTKLDAAAAVSREMVGEKMTKLLIAQSQKPEPEVNPLLVQVVLQILLVKLCISKIQSWYPDDPEILSAIIYSQIRSTGKASH